MKENENIQNQDIDFSQYKYGFFEPEEFVYKQDKGLSIDKVLEISRIKKEPEWMTQLRLKAFELFFSKPMPNWGADLSELDFNEIVYYIKPTDQIMNSWDELPESIKRTYDRLGIPEAERKFLAGVSAQYESEVVYNKLMQELVDLGVIFTDMDTALKKYEHIVKEYFGKLVPPSDNKFAALNTAVWSGGSFVYIPKGVKVSIPLQAYFRINAINMGQFERTLIIAEEDSYVHYIEGCFLEGAKVKTNRGYVNIEEIKLGTKVLTHKGVFKKVIGLFKRKYEGLIYEVKHSGSNEPFFVTAKHPLLLHKNWSSFSNTPKWMLAEDINLNDYLIMPKVQLYNQNNLIYTQNLAFMEVYAKSRISRFKPYISPTNKYFASRNNHINLGGLYYFDSNLYKLIGLILINGYWDNDSLLLKLDNNFRHIFDALNVNLLERYSHKIYHNVLRINDISLCNWVKNNLDLNKRFIPELIFGLSLEDRKNFISGMGIDIFNLNNISMIKSTYDLVHDLQFLLLDINVLTKVKKCNDSLYTLELIKDGFIKNDLCYLKIEDIKFHYVEDFVYNISVVDDETYVAQGFISHNCTAPIYSTNSLHSAVVEIYCKPRSKVRYTTIQNWANNVYNLVTKRAIAYDDATMEWIDGNIGSKKTMKYPSILLQGKNSKGLVVSVAYAGANQEQDTGTKIYHLAPNTTSEVISKSVSRYNGKTTYRGIISVSPQATNSKISVKCDALLLDENSSTDTIPVNIVNQDDTQIEHEATVSRMKLVQVYYLMSRGLSEEESQSLIVNGFIDVFTKELPMEYAVELNRLISLNMEGSVG